MPKVFAFYYGWYGTEEHDKGWFHWDQPVLDARDTARPSPSDGTIGANFFPLGGPYSSCDEDYLRKTIKEMTRAGIDVIVVSWHSEERCDQKEEWKGFQFRSTQLLFRALAEEKSLLKIAFHLEPYPGRTAASVADDLSSLLLLFGSHENTFRDFSTNRMLCFIYDSYLISNLDWEIQLSALKPDFCCIGLIVEKAHLEMFDSSFDGYYSYFGSNGFVWSSTTENWPEIQLFCAEKELIWVPCVAPGYNDSFVRPWNTLTNRERRNGDYFREMWAQARGSKWVGVTSWNEIHEGTQIEMCEPHENSFDYGRLPPDGYIELLRELKLSQEGE